MSIIGKRPILSTFLFFLTFFVIWIAFYWLTELDIVYKYTSMLYIPWGPRLSTLIERVMLWSLLLHFLYPILIFRKSRELDNSTRWKNIFISYGILLVLNIIAFAFFILMALGSSIPSTVG